MGNIKVKAGHLRQMMSILVEKTGAQSQTQKDLRIATDQISGITSEYLYKKIVLAIKKKKDSETIVLRDTQLDFIAAYLGYSYFSHYVLTLTKPISPQLSSCIGNYYSYVRQNSEKGIVFMSPARITETDRAFRFELKGPASHFSGNIQYQDGCIFILMEATSGKRFYHIYKIGKRNSPKVLQGVFAGVSTSFDPIGGRAILIRSSERFESMKNKSHKTAQLQRSKSLADRRLADYFMHYSNNNIAPLKSYTFDLDDLSEQD